MKIFLTFPSRIIQFHETVNISLEGIFFFFFLIEPLSFPFFFFFFLNRTFIISFIILFLLTGRHVFRLIRVDRSDHLQLKAGAARPAR